jgi:hypothetical protein
MILTDTLARLPGSETPTFSLDQPQFHDDHAYVSARVLVAHLPQALWPTGMPAAPSSLHSVEQVVLAGNLVRVGEQWELQHLVIGVRESVQDALSLGGRISLPGGQTLCQSEVEYPLYKKQLCSFVDIALGPDSPTSPCDALSGGSVAEAKQAVLGGIGAQAEPLGNAGCAPGIDPDNGGCGP